MVLPVRGTTAAASDISVMHDMHLEVSKRKIILKRF